MLARPKVSDTIFFQCDIQEVFRKLIYKSENVAHVARYMAKTSEVLGVPLLVTEHNSKVFGTTLKEIQEAYPKEFALFNKLRFSMLTEEVKAHLQKEWPERKNVVLYGIEAHVCVQQTALDLLINNYRVFLLVDGSSSQKEYDRAVALQRIRDAGAVLTTSESLVFELMEEASNPKFKAMLPIIKDKVTDGLSL
jgi:Isochorismatase family